MEWAIVGGVTLSAGFFVHTLLSRSSAEEEQNKVSVIDQLSQFYTILLGPWVAVLLPDLCKRTDENLARLGTNRIEITGVAFLATSIGLGISAFLLLLIFSVALGLGFTNSALISLIFGGIIGGAYFIQLNSRLDKRQRLLDNEFPFFLDFVVMTKEAGATLAQSISMFVEAARRTLLSDELSELMASDAMGPEGLLGALRNYAFLCPSQTGQQAIVAIIEAEPLGSESSSTLRSLAEDMRLARNERAESLSEQMKASIMLPVTLMLAGVIIIILAGAVPKLMFGF